MRRLVPLAIGLVLVGCGRSPPESAKESGKRAVDPQPSQRDAATEAVDPALLARFNRGVGLMGAFEFEEAESVFSELAADHAVDRDVRLNLAIAILNQTGEGAQERALAILEQLAREDPDDVRARYCIGLVRLYLGAPELALPHFEFAAAADPRDPYPLFYVGQCSEYVGRHEAAVEAYRRSAALDPYLRSPLLGLQRALGRLKRDAEADAALEAFRRLSDNPRARLAEFKYTRMGPKGEAVLPPWSATEPGPEPTPPYFEDRAIEIVGGSPVWREGRGGASITVADIDGDGRSDLFIAGGLADGRCGVLLAEPTETNAWRYRFVADHPLAAVEDVRTALWGDLDNDGNLEAYLCRKGPNRLFTRGADGAWRDRTAGSGADGGAHDTIDGALADLDHDGDLDIYLAHADGPAELLSNNLDGTFRPIGAASGARGDGRPVRQVLVLDIDRDRDADLILLHAEPPHELLLNDRLWRFTPGAFVLNDRSLEAIVSLDHDANGRVTLVGLDPTGTILATERGADGFEHVLRREANAIGVARGGGLAVLDAAGSGRSGVLHRVATGFVLRDADPHRGFEVIDEAPNPARGIELLAWTPMTTPARGPAIVVLTEQGLSVLEPTEGRGRFLTVNPSGLIDPSQAMRSNASGIGAHLAVRSGDRWSVADTFRSTSGPGQSLQPIALGLGPAVRADFVSIEWSDGVLQTEIGLDSDLTHRLVETQRQISSCPVLFAWDGQGFRFVTDLLGVGGIGYLAAIEVDDAGLPRPVYSEPRPWERLLLPEWLDLAEREGLLELRLGEPMEEALYLDAARLVAYDLPPEWSMTIDDRMGLDDPRPTGAPRFHRTLLRPRRAVDGQGRDATAALAAADGAAAEVSILDARFVGRLAEPHAITVEFDRPLDELPGEPTLVLHGWIEYPYSQTTFAAWQSGADFRPPDLEARGADGRWVRLSTGWGFPAGMPREASLPLPDVPKGADALRMTTTQEIYWDAIAVVAVEPCADVLRQELPLVEASVAFAGFPARVEQPQRRPDYDYARRSPFWGARHLPGFHTAFGDCFPLVEAIDDAVAIIGPGEEVRLRFRPIPPPRPGWTRRYVLEAEGWCKDMDLFTGEGERLEPLPLRDPASGSRERDALHRRYQTRWAEGE